MRSSTALVVIMMLLLQSCGGGRSVGSANSPTIKGVVREQGGSLLLETDGARNIYILHSSGLAFELRSLVGMRVAVSGPIVSELEGVPVLQASWYELLPFSSGERPVVGWVSPGGFIRTENDIIWKLEGDFQDLLATFVGYKVWVVGVVQERMNTSEGSWRILAVTDYGVILR